MVFKRRFRSSGFAREAPRVDPATLGPLNRVVVYWHDCIQQEDTLGQGISPLARKRSVLSPFPNDPFIFPERPHGIRISSGALSDFFVYASVQELDCYFGYPLLLFRSREDKAQVAPLFVLKLKLTREENGNLLMPEESRPTLGLQACQELGLRTEEIAVLSEKLEQLFSVRKKPQEQLAKALRLFETEAKLLINEPLDPTAVGSRKFSPSGSQGIYNQSVLFVGENTAFNSQLLNDLRELARRPDLEKTALSFLLARADINEGSEVVPVLPYPTNENQIAALRQVFANKLSVVTGPPGTGKSQFISNLVVNLFLQGKTALFVSHTNEAVNVVNSRLNLNFPDLMLRTGNKEFRQELKSRLNVLLQASANAVKASVGKADIEHEWKRLAAKRDELLEIVTREARYDRAEGELNEFRAQFGDPELSRRLQLLLPRLVELQKLSARLSKILAKLANVDYNVWEKIVLFFSPSYFEKRRDGLFEQLSKLIGPENLALLRRGKGAHAFEGADDPAWPRSQELIAAIEIQKGIDVLHRWLDSQPSKASLQEAIRRGESRFTQSSIEYLAAAYRVIMRGAPNSTGKVFSFVNSVSGTHSPDQAVPAHLFIDALRNLKVWSCTLKSLRRTFPLHPAAFDFVIFDEASQVDLPAAAPALYRAKQAIIVGDPMQLTHIATLTKDAEAGLAKAHGLAELPELYPARVMYRDVSLYKAGEACLTSSPVFLANHYRSEDQIIGLCNKVFYGGQLKVMTALDRARYPAGMPLGAEWLDCKGTTFRPAGGSRINQEEAAQVATLVQRLLSQVKGSDVKIGVVTPYSAQRELIFHRLSREISPDLFAKHDIKVLTAHKFQGSERDIMIFSPVLAAAGDGNSDGWFNAYPQILNVAMSRAKFLLYIVGDKEFCAGRTGVLSKIVRVYDEIKTAERAEHLSLGQKFDTPYERRLFEYLAKAGLEGAGYALTPKLVVKRYTLDFALLSEKNKINIECDGSHHQEISGLLDDLDRDEFLRNAGWTVFRVSNRRIVSEPETVVGEIRKLAMADA